MTERQRSKDHHELSSTRPAVQYEDAITILGMKQVQADTMPLMGCCSKETGKAILDHWFQQVQDY